MKTIQFPKSEIKLFFKELVQELEIMVLTKINVARTSVLKPV
jgi:hypothetical protein